MNITACELREKDVINICDGKRLGLVSDFEIDCGSIGCDYGRICAIFVTDKFFPLGGGGKGQIKIRWDMIKCIGDDAILVDAGREFCRSGDSCGCKEDKRKRNRFFF